MNIQQLWRCQGEFVIFIEQQSKQRERETKKKALQLLNSNQTSILYSYPESGQSFITI